MLVASFAAVAASACTAAGSAKPPTILFVCQSGTAKSPIARELLRRRAAERGIRVTAFSRGLALEDHVSPALAARLKADGINTAADTPRQLSPADWRSADLVIVFNPLPAGAKPARLRDWTDLPSVNDAYPAARAMLDQRIDRLLDEIAAGASL